MTEKNKKSKFSALTRWLGSRGVSIIVLSTLILLFLIWLIPFQVYGVPQWRIQNIATKTWLFLVGYILVLVNTFFCLWDLIFNLPKRLKKGQGIPGSREDIRGLPHCVVYPIAGNPYTVFSQLTGKLRLRGYQVTAEPDRFVLYGIRGRWAPVGNVLFHLSFFILVLGIVISMYFSFYGEIVVTEGQTFAGTEELYTKPPVKELLKIKDRLPDVSFRLDRIQPAFWKDKLLFTDLLADISYSVPALDNYYTLRLNQPFYYRGTLLGLKGFGYSPYHVLKDSTGRVVSEAFTALTVFPAGSEDSFTVKGLPYDIRVLLWPDHIREGKKIRTKTFNLANPLYQIYILKGEKKQLVYQGTLLPGETARFEGYSLSFPDLRYYGEFRIIRDPGAPVIFGALLLACTGLALRLFYYRKEILALLSTGNGQQVLYLGGRSEYYQKLFLRELERLTANLSKE